MPRRKDASIQVANVAPLTIAQAVQEDPGRNARPDWTARPFLCESAPSAIAIAATLAFSSECVRHAGSGNDPNDGHRAGADPQRERRNWAAKGVARTKHGQYFSASVVLD